MRLKETMTTLGMEPLINNRRQLEKGSTPAGVLGEGTKPQIKKKCVLFKIIWGWFFFWNDLCKKKRVDLYLKLGTLDVYLLKAFPKN
jgi:hypothetical protein